MFTKLSCVVDHPGLVVNKYEWVYGNTGNVLATGRPNEEFDEATAHVSNYLVFDEASQQVCVHN